MKKLFIASIAALFAVSAASADAPKFYIDGGIQFPVMGNLDCPDGVDSDAISGFGLDVSFRGMFTETFGLAANLGVYWPLQEELKGSDESFTVEQSDLDEWYGFNGLFGVAIKPVNKEKFGLTIIPGFAFVTEKDKKEINMGGGIKQTYSNSTSLFGIGVDVDFDIYLSKNLYLKPSIQTTVLFAGDSELITESKSWFCMTPAFAVGVRF